MLEVLASEEGQAFLAVGLLAVVKGALMYHVSCTGKGAPRQPVEVGRVTRLKIYPIKSANGTDVSTLYCDYDGLRYHDTGDRQWVVVDSRGVPITARKEGSLLFLKLTVQENSVHVDGEGMPTLVLDATPQQTANDTPTEIKSVYNHDILGTDCGNEAADWINRYLQKPAGTYRLMGCPPWLPRSRVLDGPSDQHKWADDMDLCRFQNMSACTLLNEASMADLAEKSPANVTEANFRANIHIEGAPAFDEDKYAEVHIGDVAFSKLKDTNRCPTVTVFPDTGKFHPDNEPMTTLRTYRMLPGYNSPCFCISLLTRKPGHIKVGDKVKVVLK